MTASARTFHPGTIKGDHLHTHMNTEGHKQDHSSDSLLSPKSNHINSERNINITNKLCLKGSLCLHFFVSVYGRSEIRNVAI